MHQHFVTGVFDCLKLNESSQRPEDICKTVERSLADTEHFAGKSALGDFHLLIVKVLPTERNINKQLVAVEHVSSETEHSLLINTAPANS